MYRDALADQPLYSPPGRSRRDPRAVRRGPCRAIGDAGLEAGRDEVRRRGHRDLERRWERSRERFHAAALRRRQLLALAAARADDFRRRLLGTAAGSVPLEHHAVGHEAVHGVGHAGQPRVAPHLAVGEARRCRCRAAARRQRESPRLLSSGAIGQTPAGHRRRPRAPPATLGGRSRLPTCSARIGMGWARRPIISRPF